MTHENIAGRLFDRIQHGHITDRNEYVTGMHNLLNKMHPNGEKMEEYMQ